MPSTGDWKDYILFNVMYSLDFKTSLVFGSKHLP